MSTTPSSQVSLGFDPSNNTSPPGRDTTSRKLFVGGLSVKVGESQLRAYFDRFGPVERLVIVKEKGTSKGYGFVTFKDPRDAERATFGRHYLGEKSFSCTYLLSEKQAKKQTLAERDRKLFLKNLSFATQESSIKSYFAQFGEIERVTINKNLDETSKGSGFVLFQESSAARSLLRNKMMHVIDGRSVKIFATLTKQEIKEYSEAHRGSKVQQPPSVAQSQPRSLAHGNSLGSSPTLPSYNDSAIRSSEFQTKSPFHNQLKSSEAGTCNGLGMKPLRRQIHNYGSFAGETNFSLSSQNRNLPTKKTKVSVANNSQRVETVVSLPIRQFEVIPSRVSSSIHLQMPREGNEAQPNNCQSCFLHLKPCFRSVPVERASCSTCCANLHSRTFHTEDPSNLVFRLSASKPSVAGRSQFSRQ